MGLVIHYARRKTNKIVLGARIENIFCKLVFVFVFFLLMLEGETTHLCKSLTC